MDEEDIHQRLLSIISDSQVQEAINFNILQRKLTYYPRFFLRTFTYIVWYLSADREM